MASSTNGGKHRKHRAAPTPDRDRAARNAPTTALATADTGTRHAPKRAVNPLVAAGAAIVAAASLTTGSVATAPVAESAATTVKAPSTPRVVSIRIALTAASSPWNIPVNLTIDLLNVPAYQVAGANETAAGYLYTGSFWVSNGTNVWGSDPGDPPKYTGPASLLLPNPWLNAPIKQTLTALAIAELPANSTCGTTTCPPFTPFDAQGATEAYLGLRPFPIVNNFFTVPLSALYTGFYADPTSPGQESFGGYVPTNPWGDKYPLQGTKTMRDANGNVILNPDGTPKQFQPWAGDTINLTDAYNADSAAYLTHLMSDPSDNPIMIPSTQDIQRAYTNLFAAGVVAFDPFTPGTSYCPGCVWPNEITPEGIVGAMVAADPGNDLIAGWLGNHAWQNSQGAPGTSNPPIPSTEQSVNDGKGQSTQNDYTLQQIAQINYYQLVNQLQGKYGTPVNINPGPSNGEVPPGTPGVETTPSTIATTTPEQARGLAALSQLRSIDAPQVQKTTTEDVSAVQTATPTAKTPDVTAPVSTGSTSAGSTNTASTTTGATNTASGNTGLSTGSTATAPAATSTPASSGTVTDKAPTSATNPGSSQGSGSTSTGGSFSSRLRDAVTKSIGGNQGASVADSLGLGKDKGTTPKNGTGNTTGTSGGTTGGNTGKPSGTSGLSGGGSRSAGQSGSTTGKSGDTSKSGDNGSSRSGDKSGHGSGSN